MAVAGWYQLRNLSVISNAALSSQPQQHQSTALMESLYQQCGVNICNDRHTLVFTITM
jgi:hypothetical protein